jgi:hypothetical protein
MFVYWICFFIDHYNPNSCKVESESEFDSDSESVFDSDLEFESKLEKQDTVKPSNDICKQTFDSRLDYFLYDEETGVAYKI